MSEVRGSIRSVSALVALLAVVAACNAGAPAASPTPAGPSPLTGTSWSVTQLAGAAPTAPATLVFEEDTAGGSAGCNTFSMSYSADSSALTFGPIAMTKKLCGDPADSFEDAYVTALTNTAKYTLSGTELSLMDAGGQTVLKYSAAAPASVEGRWIVTGYNSGSAVSSPIVG